MSDDHLRYVVADLRARVERLERELDLLLGHEPLEDQPAPPSAPSTPPPSSSSPPVPPPVIQAPPIAPPNAGPRAVEAGPAASKSKAPRPWVRPEKRKVKGAERVGASQSMELFIGRQVVAWVGTIIVLLAVGLGLKLAYDTGLLARIPPVVRCLVAAAFGLALIGTGELTQRKLGRLAAVGLFSAGIGTLYLTSYAAFRMELVASVGGLLLLLLTAAVGFGVTWRAESTTTGVLSVVGGYFSPLLLGGPASTAQSLPFYISMLLGVSLLLSAIAPRPFRTVRYVSLCCHGLVALVWISVCVADVWDFALPFLTGWWILINAEGVYAARHRQSPIGNAVVSLVATAWFIFIGTWLLQYYIPTGPDWLGLFTLATGVAAGAGALSFGPGLDALRKAPVNAMEKLAAALWLEAGALLATSIALQFDGYGASVGWLVVALACVEMGRRLGSLGVLIFAGVVGALALGRIATIDWFTPGMDAALAQTGAFVVTKRAVLALLGVGCTYAAGVRINDRSRPMYSATSTVLAVLGTLGWIAICMEVTDVALYQTLGYLACSAALMGARRLELPRDLSTLGAFLLILAAGKWLLADALGSRLAPSWDALADRPMVNLQMLTAVVITAMGWWALRQASGGHRAADRGPSAGSETAPGRWWSIAQPWQGALVVIACFFLTALSLEVERVIATHEEAQAFGVDALWDPPVLRSLWLTLLWGVGGLGLGMLSRLASWRIVLQSGLVIVFTAVMFWLFVDTLGSRFLEGMDAVPARVVLNLQFGVGAALLGTVIVSMRLMGRTVGAPAMDPIFGRMALMSGFALVGAIVLWLGSMEIDRFFAQRLSAKQTALSVYWAVFSIALILIGFVRSVALVRYAGLTLFGITVAKVFFVDMPVARVAPIFRVVSGIIVGLLLLATSVAYAKFAPRLLRKGGEEEGDTAEPLPE